MSGSRTVTVPENLCDLAAYTDPTTGFRRRSAEMQFVGGRNVVVNYGQPIPPIFERSGSLNSLTRRHSASGKENLAPIEHDFMMPPPDLSEETLLPPDHNEILAKLKFISQYVDTIIEVARHKAAPLSNINESLSPRSSRPGELDPNSPMHRRIQQLLLYVRCMQMLSQSLEFSKAELKSKRLKPSTTVKTGTLKYCQ